MFRNATFSVVFVTVYLMLYLTLLHIPIDLRVILLMLVCSPFLLLWMIYTILKYGVYDGEKLGENEEWGYEDRRKEDLGTFF